MNLTNPTNITSLYNMESWVDIMAWANTESNTLFTMFLLLSVFIISYTYMQRYRPESAFTASALSTALLSFIFYAVGFLDPRILLGIILLIVGAVAVTKYKETP